MEDAPRDAVEPELRRAFDAGDLTAVASMAIRAYGPELYGFLVGLARDADAAGEIFASACEKLWRALPGFRWDSTLRVWAYAIARNQFHHWLRVRDRQRLQVPLSDAPALSALVAAVRSTTAVHQRSEVKDGFARLRETLAPDDQALLGLRVDGGLAWNDIARVLAGEDAPPPSPREVATLRKRFERLKRDLRERARAAKLVPD
jgi:RNA polymerase sigma-70 factor (ECF subfamily)